MGALVAARQVVVWSVLLGPVRLLMAGAPADAAPMALPPRCTFACRENERLRAECASLADRVRVNGSSQVHAEGEAAAAAADAAAARQQLAAAQLAAAEAEVAAERARGDAQAAQAAARKLETDLEDLSAAYSNLDAHAGSLQSQVEQLELDLAAARQQAGAAGPASGHQQGSDRGGVGEEEVRRQVEAARQEAAQEADEAMGDLLVCLGQEEAKVGGGGGGEGRVCCHACRLIHKVYRLGLPRPVLQT